MKKTITIQFSILFLVLLVSCLNVTALSKPSSTIPFKSGYLNQQTMLEILPPISPGTSYEGECSPWDIKSEYCNGDVRHYVQCVLTASGGVWNDKSERCSDYGNNVMCLGGSCVKKNEVIFSFLWLILPAMLLVIIIILAFKLKRKRR